MVGYGREEVLENPEPMRAIEADQVEACCPAPLGGIYKPTPQIANVLFVQCTRLYRIIGEGSDRHCGWRKRHFFGVKVGAVDTRVSELNAGECAVLFHLFGHFRDHRDIGVVPETKLDEGCDLGGMVHFALFGENNAPAALGFDTAHGCRRRRIAISAAVTVRHLVESILGKHRPDCHRLKQDIVALIAAHNVLITFQNPPQAVIPCLRLVHGR